MLQPVQTFALHRLHGFVVVDAQGISIAVIVALLVTRVRYIVLDDTGGRQVEVVDVIR